MLSSVVSDGFWCIFGSALSLHPSSNCQGNDPLDNHFKALSAESVLFPMALHLLVCAKCRVDPAELGMSC